MNYLIHLTSVLVFFLAFSGKPKPYLPKAEAFATAGINRSDKESSEFIPWMDKRKLNWDDFKSSPQINSDAVASTSTEMGLTYVVKNNIFSYNITCNFSKIKSWGIVKTPYILAHEQGHFDVTEIFARKLHKALQEYNFNYSNYRNDISRIYDNIVEEKEAFQKSYDKHSDHSRNHKHQVQWQDKIQELLLETALFADYP
ncbi:MAG: DUF922 domain-containing protein [Chitinophagaceae bacterium]